MQTILSPEWEDTIGFFIDQIPGYILIKDTRSTFLKACSKSARVFGLNHPDDIVGLKDSDLKDEIAQYANLFAQQDTKLLHIKKPINGFYAISHDGKLRSYIYNKSILKDKKNKIIGIISQSNEIRNPALNRIINKLYNVDATLKSQNKKMVPINYYLTNDNDEDFSIQQFHCLFYLMRHKSVSDIAKILKLPIQKVEENIEQIKEKLHCHTISELIGVAIGKGYFEVIPSGMLMNEPFIPQSLNPPLSSLSLQKRKCLTLLVQGSSIKEIASILRLSRRTVEHYLEHLRVIYDCRNSRELVAKYFLLKGLAGVI
jgi:DNA-binding CsgD family transcriptional regulator